MASKQDTHFIDVFSLLIGLLALVAIVLFVFARLFAEPRQLKDIYSTAQYMQNTKARIQPFSREAIAGHDNAGLAIVAANSSAGSASVALPIPKNGEQAFKMVCSTCHAKGIGGAPVAGNATDWDPRIAKGLAVLYQHALHGFQSKGHVMPAKGGRADIPDAVIKQAVNYMVGLVRHHR